MSGATSAPAAQSRVNPRPKKEFTAEVTEVTETEKKGGAPNKEP